MPKVHESISRLVAAGISLADAQALRRISMTLHRWHELECGDSNDHGSVVLVRGQYEPYKRIFTHDDNGAPFLEYHFNDGHVQHVGIPDRETGSLKRLAKIMAKYPGFVSYVQGDPRGAALYILRPDDVRPGEAVNSYYSRGIAVYK